MPRILTYNVHRCIGVDGRLDVARVSGVIAALEPDIVALQELDVGRARTGGVDQAHEIARRLDMACHFNAAVRVEEEQYGDAILTSYPERLIKAAPLPGLSPRLRLEPRGALWITVEIDGVAVQIINTHMGLVPKEQQRQATALAGLEWLRRPDCRGPVILLGDLNDLTATGVSVVDRTLAAQLGDARRLSPRRRPTATFPSRMPLLRIDHMFVSAAVKVLDLYAPALHGAQVASDHLPLVMDFEVRG